MNPDAEKRRPTSARGCSRRRGLTLMELIVVLAVAAIVSAIAIPLAMNSVSGVRERKCQSSRDIIYTYYILDQKLNGGGRSLDYWIAYCQSDAAGDEHVDACPAGGTYTAAADGGSVVCSVHGGA